MSLFDIFSTAGSAMNAQSIRLNIIASNMANINSVAGSADEAYKAKGAVFGQLMHQINSEANGTGVTVTDVIESQREHEMTYQPDHPFANDEGYVFRSNVNPMEEMANMISASRSYQTNVEILDAAKSLMRQTIRLGE
ncbi:flagellar basal body rod protein FlgC [Chromatiales bacterium (ex Bugula neritina AB1)]|nr:flagellar basal body rod protein FlgC [Chromatiales bacterium (ex Bugula neritina AB1)]